MRQEQTATKGEGILEEFIVSGLQDWRNGDNDQGWGGGRRGGGVGIMARGLPLPAKSAKSLHSQPYIYKMYKVYFHFIEN